MEILVPPEKNYIGTGTQTDWIIPFDYLRKAYVHVVVDDDETTAFTIENKINLIFDVAPAAGAKIRIYRSTPTTRLVSWNDASVLHAKDMTIQQVQELHILEEEDYRFQGIEDRVDNLVDTAQAFAVSAENSASTAQNAANVAINAQNITVERASYTDRIIAAGFLLAEDLTVVDGKVCLVFNE